MPAVVADLPFTAWNSMLSQLTNTIKLAQPI